MRRWLAAIFCRWADQLDPIGARIRREATERALLSAALRREVERTQLTTYARRARAGR